jgi:hypothetical protein
MTRKKTFEARLKVEVEYDDGLDEGSLAECVEEHMQVVFDSWDYANTEHGDLDVVISMLYFDSYEEE